MNSDFNKKLEEKAMIAVEKLLQDKSIKGIYQRKRL